MSKLSVGEKIRLIRKHAGISQLDLETAIGASSGSISRIENGNVNPTKETLRAIAEALKLPASALAYLYGIADEDPTEEEIRAIKEEVSTVMQDSNSYIYILDFKSRFIAFSKGFKDLAKEVGLNTDTLLGINVVEVFFNPEHGYTRIFDPEHFEEMGIGILSVAIQERYYRFYEEWWQSYLKRLFKLPRVKELWEKSEKLNLNLLSHEARTIYFILHGKSTPMLFSMTPIFDHPKFFMIEYQKVEK